MKSVKDLTDNELNILIAEDQGYHPHPDNDAKDQKWWSFGGEGYGLPIGVPKKICAMPPLNSGMWGEIGPLPNYPGDLNAMHEAEQIITSWHQYQEALRVNVLGNNWYTNVVLEEVWRVETHATARQRAEAYAVVRKLALP